MNKPLFHTHISFNVGIDKGKQTSLLILNNNLIGTKCLVLSRKTAEMRGIILFLMPYVLQLGQLNLCGLKQDETIN